MVSAARKEPIWGTFKKNSAWRATQAQKTFKVERFLPGAGAKTFNLERFCRGGRAQKRSTLNVLRPGGARAFNLELRFRAVLRAT